MGGTLPRPPDDSRELAAPIVEPMLEPMRHG